MSRSLFNGTQRATRGLLTAVTVGLMGAAITAGALVAASGDATPATDATVPFQTLPTPVPIPAGLPGSTDTMLMAPRSDVLTYSLMSDAWNRRPVEGQEWFCNKWMNATDRQEDRIVARVMDNATDDQADFLEHGTIRQFFDEACADLTRALSVDAKPEIGTGESRPRPAAKPVGRVGPASSCDYPNC